jgi:hypothetical protein
MCLSKSELSVLKSVRPLLEDVEIDLVTWNGAAGPGRIGGNAICATMVSRCFASQLPFTCRDRPLQARSGDRGVQCRSDYRITQINTRDEEIRPLEAKPGELPAR